MQPGSAVVRSMLDQVKTWSKVILLTSVLVGVVAEIGLRVVGFEHPNFYRYDPVRGWAHQPLAHGHFRSEGDAYVEINSQGLRDREHVIKKPAGTVRIAILGDSYAEALQLPMEETFWSHLERGLGRCARFAGKTVEVINFGVSSYGTANEYLSLEEAWRYEPDIVLLAFLTGNDFLDNSRELDRQTGPRPFFRLSGGGLVLDQSRNVPPSEGRRAWAFARGVSRTIQLVQRLRDVRAERASASSVPTARLDLDSAIYAPPHSDAWRESWGVTEALILKIRDNVSEHRADFWLTTLSNPLQVDIDTERRERFMNQYGLTDLFYPDHRLEEFAKRANIASIVLAPDLLMVARREHKCLHGFPNTANCEGHWNADGHRAAGELVTKRICAGQ